VVKQPEIAVFDALRHDHPEFGGDVVRWEPGPDPPDFIGTHRDGTKVSIELTEWLDGRQASASIRRTEAKYAFWETLNSTVSARPRIFSVVQVSLREGARLAKRHGGTFRAEFFELITHLDDNWQQLLSGYPQPIWTDFSGHPTVAKYVSGLLFYRSPLIQHTGGPWIIFEATGGAYTHGPFHRVYLYFAFNEGALIQVWGEP
jgi:hypothetical protein